jgi:hypothetical protein
MERHEGIRGQDISDTATEQRNNHGPASWHLVQVDPDETNNRQARSVRERHVKCYVRNGKGSTKRLVHCCKHRPLIREIKQPSGEFGEIIMFSPNDKVEEILAKKPHTQGWCQGTVNLGEQGIVGPFNLTID